jgi:pimeloyl-ACP methyl ester carboxylesterase
MATPSTSNYSLNELSNPPPSENIEQAEVEEIRLADVPDETATSCRRFRWNQFSLAKLIEGEKQLLSTVKSPILSRFVKVSHDEDSEIYTLSFESSEYPNRIPFVLIHGFAAGSAIWTANIDELTAERPVHALDIIGFGRSSRPKFNADPDLAEKEFVQSIEDWRKAMGIEKMILVGHSFGI